MAAPVMREFRTDIPLYEKGRPDYSHDSIEFLLNRVGALSFEGDLPVKILEIAAGTGNFTRVMVEVLASKAVHSEIIASDSQEAMCELFPLYTPGIEMLHFAAENIALPDESVPIIICAQAFHWFANEKSVAEIFRVLKPGGKFGMIWNHRDFSIPWVRAMQDIIEPFFKKKDMPVDPRQLKWMECIDSSGKFTSVERNASFRIYQEGGIDDIVAAIMCLSAISQSSVETKAEVESKIRDILTNHPGLEGVQEYKLPYITDICWCTKK